jgi:hypothetical protein
MAGCLLFSAERLRRHLLPVVGATRLIRLAVALITASNSSARLTSATSASPAERFGSGAPSSSAARSPLAAGSPAWGLSSRFGLTFSGVAVVAPAPYSSCSRLAVVRCVADCGGAVVGAARGLRRRRRVFGGRPLAARRALSSCRAGSVARRRCPYARSPAPPLIISNSIISG